MTGVDIWAELGIEPTGDARTIKRAYATRLKAERSASDTARFLALRSAYEMALQLADALPKTRGGPPDDATAPPSPGDDPIAWQVAPLPRQLGRSVPVWGVDAESAPATVRKEHPPAAGQDADDFERRAKAPRGPRQDIHPLLEALQSALSRQAPADELTQLARRVLDHRDLQRISSRDEAEQRLVEMLASAGETGQAVLKLFAAEFDWAQDQVGLMRRFPAHADDLARWLQPAPWAAPAPLPEPPRPKPPSNPLWLSRPASQWLTSHWVARILVLLWWPKGRRAIAKLLHAQHEDLVFSAPLHRWWGRALIWVAPINLHLLLLFFGWAGFRLLIQSPFLEGSELQQFFFHQFSRACAWSAGGWLLVSWPLHLARLPPAGFSRMWPILAAWLFLFAHALHGITLVPEAFVGGFFLLLTFSVARLFRPSAPTMVLLSIISITVLAQSLDLFALRSDLAAINGFAVSVAMILLLTEESLHRRLPITKPWRVASCTVMLVGLAVAGAPWVDDNIKSCTIFAALLLSHWLAPLPSPLWIDRVARLRWLAPKLMGTPILLRALVLLSLWLVCKLLWPDSLARTEGAAMLLVMGLWRLGCWLPAGLSRWRERSAQRQAGLS